MVTKSRYTVVVRSEGDVVNHGVYTSVDRAYEVARKVNEALSKLSPRPDAVAGVERIYPETSARGILRGLGLIKEEK